MASVLVHCRCLHCVPLDAWSLSAHLSPAEGKELIISYTVKHEQDLDCGGAYIKVGLTQRSHVSPATTPAASAAA